MYEATRALVIASGTEPAIPAIDGLAGTPYWTNHDAIEAETLPRSLVVLGRGAIGLELAQVFARFGVAVTVVEAADRLLPMEEPEAGALAAAALARDGVRVHIGAGASNVSYQPARGFTITLGEADAVAAEALLVAVGRRADLRSLAAASR